MSELRNLVSISRLRDLLETLKISGGGTSDAVERLHGEYVDMLPSHWLASDYATGHLPPTSKPTSGSGSPIPACDKHPRSPSEVATACIEELLDEDFNLGLVLIFGFVCTARRRKRMLAPLVESNGPAW